MSDHSKYISEPVSVSAPCRMDMGGTLDISTFYYPLRHLNPCTFNIAVNLRTRVRILPYIKGKIKVSSKGFESAEYPPDAAPFDHPLGLMFAVAAYFRADGVHIEIESASPPRSALGGSSAAAAALVAAFLKSDSQDEGMKKEKIVKLAHALEESVAGVPCGLQDQLAAVYGGVNAWYWTGDPDRPVFIQKSLAGKECKNSFFAKKNRAKNAEFYKMGLHSSAFNDLESCLLLAYCGIPHESSNINGRWVREFISGKTRDLWTEIISCTHTFIDALTRQDMETAVSAMNRELALRKKMTPDVLDETGEKLTAAAAEHSCGARFAGAGGGGCLWALGDQRNVDRLKKVWEKILSEKKGAAMLNLEIAWEGLLYDK